MAPPSLDGAAVFALAVAPPSLDGAIYICMYIYIYMHIYRGMMEDKMETTIMGYMGIIGTILGLYRDDGKENGNYYNGLSRDYRDYIVGYIRIMEKKMETNIMGYMGIIGTRLGYISISYHNHHNHAR